MIIILIKILRTNACEASEYFFAIMQECTLEIVFVWIKPK